MNIFSFCKHNKIILVSFIVLGFFLFVLTFEPTLNLAPEKEEGLPDFSFEDVDITEIEDGVMLWNVQAKKASIYENDNTIRLQESEGDVFENARKTVHFKAPLGRFSIDDESLYLIDAETVVFFPENTMNVNAHELTWNLKTNDMIGEGIVLVESNVISISGDRINVDYYNNHIVLDGDVSVNVRSGVIE